MILTTRLEEDNKIVQKSLKAYKIKSIGEPLYKIKYLSKTLYAEEDKIFIVASKQAVKIIQSKINLKNLRNSIFFVIGKQAANKLKKNGLKVQLVSKNSKDLISKIKKYKKYKKNKFEYLCGNIFNKDFMMQLRKYNKNSKKNIIYHMLPNKKFSKKTLLQLKKQNIKMILIFSKYACKSFFSICKFHKLEKSTLSKIRYITLSKDIAIMPQLNRKEVIWATQPQLASMLKKATTHYSA